MPDRIKAIPPIAQLAAALGHDFASEALLVQAITHPSVDGLGTPRSRRGLGATGRRYEQLEFLGDRVLGLVIATWLLEMFPQAAEGELAKRHTGLVRAEALARVAESVDLGSYLRLAPGEEGSGGRRNPAILADAAEAAIAALYLDGGLAAADAFIRKAWAPLVEETASAPHQDPKTGLQEWAQARGFPLPHYRTLGHSGPDHDPVFEVEVTVGDAHTAAASGRSKQQAQKAAAQLLLGRLQGATE